ncbi:MAG: hypothetical protein QOF43_1288 [Gaiellaceae bacterium]|nr:hypothetical protein [Gaiellaceae bacterium]
MPSSGELRLRTLILALIALGGIWIALVIQRGHDAPGASFASGPQPSDFAAPELLRVKGLNRPVAATPVASVSPRVKPFTRVPTRQTPDVQILAASAKPDRKVKPAKAPALDVVPGVGRSYAETVTPPLETLAISDAQVTSVTSSSARITWKTNLPAQTQAAFGLDAPTIWSQPSADSLVEHESVLTGLEFSTTYQVYLHAVDEWNRAQTTTVSITTQPMGSRSIATTNGGQIVVDDRPFFPTAVWAQCSDGFGSNIDDGINLFMGDGCSTDEADLASRLDGRAYSIVNAANADADGQGVIGWYYPDEWDAFLQSTVTRQQLDKSIPPPRSGRISFLTLTNHFYSLASPLPQGKGMYPLLMSIPDVVGFDLYPLLVWCRPAFGDVMDAQRELHTTSGGKPTFQWIEAAPMEHECKNDKQLDPTPATVRAETWLAVAGGAAAIGYFPNHWSTPIGTEISRTNREIKALSQALLAPAANATSDSPSVRVSARTLNGATYVIAVNTTESTLQAKFTVEGIGGRSPVVVGGGQVVGADDTGFTDNFGPLAARVYIIPPAGW